jgi:RNA polymerase sigma factor (sigma-70 family)
VGNVRRVGSFHSFYALPLIPSLKTVPFHFLINRIPLREGKKVAIKHDARAVCFSRQTEPGLSKPELLLKFWSERYMFLAYMSRFIPDEEARRDIFQEACVRFLASSAVFDCIEKAAKYFYVIIRSLSIEDAKRAGRLSYYAELPEVVFDPQKAWHSRMLIDEVREATRGLSVRDQQVLAAQFSQELPHLRGKCKHLGLPSSTFRYRRNKAVLRLRRVLTVKTYPIR